jgi:diguanylate cyclase (GGDEF)-like protein
MPQRAAAPSAPPPAAGDPRPRAPSTRPPPSERVSVERPTHVIEAVCSISDAQLALRVEAALGRAGCVVRAADVLQMGPTLERFDLVVVDASSLLEAPEPERRALLVAIGQEAEVLRISQWVDHPVTASQPPEIVEVALVQAVRRALERVRYRRAEEALRLYEERAESARREATELYALAIAGANDGLWDWDLPKGELRVTSRWRAQLGIEGDPPSGSPDLWLGRVHPDDLEDLRRAIDGHVSGATAFLAREHRMLHRDGTYRWMLARGIASRDTIGRPIRLAGSQTDITDRKAFDPVTGLPNRMLFLDRTDNALGRAARSQGKTCALLLFDIDAFRGVNERFGGAAGDRLLYEVGRRLKKGIEAGETAARTGGAEFAVLIENVSDPAAATDLAKRLQAVLAAPVILMDTEEEEVFPSASVGVAFGTPEHRRADELLRDATTALGRAKQRGRGRCEVFDPAMRRHVVARSQFDSALRRALDRRELFLLYQPIVDLTSGILTGFEALMRWRHPERGMIPPNDFIPIAEDSGLIIPIGRWALAEACRQLVEWSEGLRDRTLTMSVNLAARQIADGRLVDDVAEALATTGVDARFIKLEITESGLMENLGAATHTLSRLRALGVGLSIDDFGTGYSSLSYLHRFPSNTLKIDRSFVGAMDLDQSNVEIVRAIVAVAHSLGMDVVAEGVETATQRDRLRDLGCDQAQGYFYARPMTVEAAAELLRRADTPLALPRRGALALDSGRRPLRLRPVDPRLLSWSGRSSRWDRSRAAPHTDADASGADEHASSDHGRSPGRRRFAGAAVRTGSARAALRETWSGDGHSIERGVPAAGTDARSRRAGGGDHAQRGRHALLPGGDEGIRGRQRSERASHVFQARRRPPVLGPPEAAMSSTVLGSLAEARLHPEGYVVLEGDWGGQIYLTVRASTVRCSEVVLHQLLQDLDALAWPGNGGSGARITYDVRTGSGHVPGGMGGAPLGPDLWLHDELVGRGFEPAVREVLEGKRSALGHASP